MVDSNWYRQVTKGADRLVERIRKLITYTQREWDRTVGWGKVPIAYSKEWSNYEISRAKKILENGEVKNETLHTQTK